MTSLRELELDGWTASAVRAQLDACRWQRIGRAVLRHNGSPSRDELCDIALVNLGPRAVLTSFTRLQAAGMRGWERSPVHVLVPRGARIRRPVGLDWRIHYTDSWRVSGRGPRLDCRARATLLAAASFVSQRPACGILAAAVQQRLLRPVELLTALDAMPRLRHRAALIAAGADIAQGAQALSEIDFVRLCRQAGLPLPQHQAVRRMPNGRRRYVDATWIRRDGRRVVVEVDGALHLIVGQWWNDQLRQNEFAIADDVVLRFPTVVVRHESHLVIDQLSRALHLPQRVLSVP